MKISQLIRKLESLKAKHGNLEVLMTPMNDEPQSVSIVQVTEVEEDDQYPKTYGMPKGFTFLELTN